MRGFARGSNEFSGLACYRDSSVKRIRRTGHAVGETSRLILAEDDPRLRMRFGRLLRSAGWHVDEVRDGAAVLELVQAEDYDVVLLDLRLPELDGLAVLECLQGAESSPAVVLMSGHLDVDSTLAALRSGAAEVLEKPIPPARLLSVLAEARARRHGKRVERSQNDIPELVGRSRAMRVLSEQVLTVASYPDLPAMILGETGTGKELVAQAIHRHCQSEDPIVSINCAALPDALFESEVFGHVSGAFTGAQSGRKGLLELAGAGTVFLDEVGELAPLQQAKLLRVLETRTFRRVGSNQVVALRARIVSATNRELARGDAGFRADLFHRLAGTIVRTPSLRDRMEDIELLACHLIERFSAGRPSLPRIISAAGIEALHAHDWPGNVRELNGVIQSAAIRAAAPSLGVRPIVEAMRDRGCFAERADEGPEESGTYVRGDLPTVEREMILRAYGECSHNLSRTARRVNIPRSTLRDRLKRYGVL